MLTGDKGSRRETGKAEGRQEKLKEERQSRRETRGAEERQEKLKGDKRC